MQNVWALASLWVGLALIATLLAIWFKISTALSEIVVGTVAQLIIGAIVGPMGLAREVRVDHFSCRNGRDRPDFPRWCRTRSSDLPNEMEGSNSRWARRLLRAIFGLYGSRTLRPALDGHVELARRRGALHDLRSGCVRSDARTGPQQDRIREGDSGSVLRK